MPLDLTSVRAKLGRAQEHTYALKEEIRAWMHHCPYRYTIEKSADARRYAVTIRRRGQCIEPIEKWALIIGDAAHNLRSALDHLTYAIAVHETGKNPPPDEKILSFPIIDQPSTFARFRGRVQSTTLSAPVWAAIENVQPYNRKHPELPPLLAILSDIDNTDKHRLLKLALATPLEVDLGFFGPHVPLGTRVEVGAFHGEIEDGTEIASFTFDRPTPGMNFDRVNIDMVFAIWHGKRDSSDSPWKERTDVGALLDAITKEVHTVVQDVATVVGSPAP